MTSLEVLGRACPIERSVKRLERLFAPGTHAAMLPACFAESWLTPIPRLPCCWHGSPSPGSLQNPGCHADGTVRRVLAIFCSTKPQVSQCMIGRCIQQVGEPPAIELVPIHPSIHLNALCKSGMHGAGPPTRDIFMSSCVGGACRIERPLRKLLHSVLDFFRIEWGSSSRAAPRGCACGGLPVSNRSFRVTHGQHLAGPRRTFISHCILLAGPANAFISHCQLLAGPARAFISHFFLLSGPARAFISHCFLLAGSARSFVSHWRLLAGPASAFISHCQLLASPARTFISHCLLLAGSARAFISHYQLLAALLQTWAWCICLISTPSPHACLWNCFFPLSSSTSVWRKPCGDVFFFRIIRVCLVPFDHFHCRRLCAVL